MSHFGNSPSAGPAPGPAQPGAAGFTLVELLVSLAITSVLILGVLATFDFSARMNRTQTHLADMQQSLRIAQNEVVKLSRMAGRGDLPANVAVERTNNAAAGTVLVAGDPKTEIYAGTDVLRLRGIFTSTVYQIDPDAAAGMQVFEAPDADGRGWALVQPTTQGVPQDLAAFLAAAAAGESLVMISPKGTHHVALVEDADMDGTNLRIQYKKHPSEAALGGTLTPALHKITSIGVLEEYVFYVRAQGGDAPILARARMEPGTNLPYKGDPANATIDLADNILDLQVAYGVGVVGQPELRVTTLARTDRRDPGYQAPLLPATIEDHAYPANHPLNARDQRNFRWRLMRTDINLRNI